jgi:hypothetical protein
MGVPCITLQGNTERPETITEGFNELKSFRFWNFFFSHRQAITHATKKTESTRGRSSKKNLIAISIGIPYSDCITFVRTKHSRVRDLIIPDNAPARRHRFNGRSNFWGNQPSAYRFPWCYSPWNRCNFRGSPADRIWRLAPPSPRHLRGKSFKLGGNPR